MKVIKLLLLTAHHFYKESRVIDIANKGLVIFVSLQYIKGRIFIKM